MFVGKKNWCKLHFHQLLFAAPCICFMYIEICVECIFNWKKKKWTESQKCNLMFSFGYILYLKMVKIKILQHSSTWNLISFVYENKMNIPIEFSRYTINELVLVPLKYITSTTNFPKVKIRFWRLGYIQYTLFIACLLHFPISFWL